MTTTLQRPEELRKDREDFREFLEAHDELDTLTRPGIGQDEGGPGRGRRLAAAFAMIALVVAAIVVAIMVDFGGSETSMTRAGETEDEALARLVQHGYIPAQALSPQTYWTGHDFAPRAAQPFVTEDEALARLVRRGYIPAAALAAATYWTNHDFAPTAPPRPAELQATMDLVNRRLVPAGTLESVREAQATLDLVNRGLVPAESLVARTLAPDVSGSDVHLQDLADEIAPEVMGATVLPDHLVSPVSRTDVTGSNAHLYNEA